MEYIRIGDIAKSIVSGGTPKSTKSEYYNGNIPWLNTKEINFNRIYSTEKCITAEGLKNSSAKYIKENCIIIAMYGATAGRAAINKIPLTTNQACCNIEVNASKMDYNYVYYAIKNDWEHLASLANGGAQQNLNSLIIKDFKIPYVDLNTQKKVSKILSAIDKKMELNNKINNNLYELGESYFEDYLSNCTDEIQIKDIAAEILDYTKNENKKVKLLNSSDITENVFPKVDFVDNKDLKGHFKKRFKKYDILYSQIRPRNHHYGYVLLEDADNYLASTRFMVVRNKKDKVSSSLLYFYLTSKSAIDDFTTKTELRSGTFPQGNYEDLSSFVIKYSTNQEKVTKLLDSILEKMNINNEENSKLSELRDTLLPRLMTGEIDLDNIEI